MDTNPTNTRLTVTFHFWCTDKCYTVLRTEVKCKPALKTMING